MNGLLFFTVYFNILLITNILIATANKTFTNITNNHTLRLYALCVSAVSSAEPDGSSVKWLSAWEPSWGFVRADTLLLCVQLSRLHTEVWEAVCRCGSQLQRERRACDRGTLSLVQGSVGAQRRGTGKPEPLHRQQTEADGGEISRKVNPPRDNKQEGQDIYHREEN